MDNLIQTTAWSMLHSFWIGALLYGLLQISLAVYRNVTAHTRYLLSYTALLLMFMSFMAFFWSNIRFSVPVFEADFPLTATDPAWPDLTPQSAPQLSFLQPFYPYLVSGYAAGLLLQCTFLLIGLLRIYYFRKNGLLSVSADWQQLFEQALDRLQIERRVQFFLSEKVTSPLVTGFMKPMVLFPVAMANHLDLKQTELILLHELSHIRRNDYLLNLLQTVMETFLFFNPFVWLCSRIIRAEREHACDDQVLQISHAPLEYAHTLFHVAVHSQKQRPTLALGATGQHKHHLLQRIKRITTMKTTENQVRQPVLAVLMAILVASSLAWVKPQQPEQTTQKPAGTETLTFTNTVTKTAVRIQQVTDQDRPTADTIKIPAKASVAINAAGELPAAEALSKVAVVRGSKDGIPGGIPTDPAQIFRYASVSFPEDSTFKRVFRGDSLNIITAKVKEYFESPKMKEVMEKITREAVKMSVKGDSLRFAYGPELKAHTDALKLQSMALIRQLDLSKLKTDSLIARFNTEEFRAKIKEVSEFYKSEEYKALQEKFNREVEVLKQKKQKK